MEIALRTPTVEYGIRKPSGVLLASRGMSGEKPTLNVTMKGTFHSYLRRCSWRKKNISNALRVLYGKFCAAVNIPGCFDAAVKVPTNKGELESFRYVYYFSSANFAAAEKLRRMRKFFNYLFM